MGCPSRRRRRGVIGQRGRRSRAVPLRTSPAAPRLCRPRVGVVTTSPSSLHLESLSHERGRTRTSAPGGQPVSHPPFLRGPRPPITISCIRTDVEKQMVFLSQRLLCVRKVRCVRSSWPQQACLEGRGYMCNRGEVRNTTHLTPQERVFCQKKQRLKMDY